MIFETISGVSFEKSLHLPLKWNRDLLHAKTFPFKKTRGKIFEYFYSF